MTEKIKCKDFMDRNERRVRMRWHEEFARRYLPLLPKHIMRNGVVYTLDIAPGYAGYSKEGEVLVGYSEDYTGLAARKLCEWFECFSSSCSEVVTRPQRPDYL